MNKSGVLTGVTMSAMIAVVPFLAPSTVLADAPSFDSQYQSNASQESSLLQTANASTDTTSANSSEISTLQSTVSNLNTQISSLYTVEQNLANADSTMPQTISWNLNTQLDQLNQKRQQLLKDSREQWKSVNKYHFRHDHKGEELFAHFKNKWKAIGSQLADVDDRLSNLKEKQSKIDLKKPFNDSLNSLQNTILKLQSTTIQYTKAWIALEQSGSATTSTGTSNLSAPTNLSVSNLSNTSFTVSWTGVSGATGYNVYLNGARVGSINSNNDTSYTYTFSGEQPSTTYHVTVSAIDAQGNNSAQSNTATATTSPFSVTATSPTTNGFSLHWSPINGASYYDVRVLNTNGTTVVALNHVSGTSENIANLSANTTYNVYVTAMSDSNVQIAKSDTPSVSTLSN